jgi:hypothetical protein
MSQSGENRGHGELPPGAKRRRGRKPYRTPRLVVYGDLRRITGAKGGISTDGGSGNSKL